MQYIVPLGAFIGAMSMVVFSGAYMMRHESRVTPVFLFIACCVMAVFACLAMGAL